MFGIFLIIRYLPIEKWYWGNAFPRCNVREEYFNKAMICTKEKNNAKAGMRLQ
jgi:hypothetical protein